MKRILDIYIPYGHDIKKISKVGTKLKTKHSREVVSYMILDYEKNKTTSPKDIMVYGVTILIILN